MLFSRHLENRCALFASILSSFSLVAAALPARADTVRATPAFNAVNGIGLSTHFGYDGTIYDTQFASLKAAIGELCIRHVRDTVNQFTGLARIRDLYNTYGVKMLATIDARNSAFRADPGGIDAKLNMLTAGLPTAAISAIESINEPNLQNTGYGYSGWQYDVRNYQQALAAKVRSRSALAALPILGPALAYPNQSPAYGQLGNISAWATANNAHPYPNWLSFEDDAAMVLPVINVNVPGGPNWFTETGWHTAFNAHAQPLDENSRAKNVTRTILYSAIQPSVKRTYFYQLVDDQADPGLTRIDLHFGLINYYMQKTPQYYAVRNTMRILCDKPLTFDAQTLSYRLTGDLTNVMTGLFQKNDRSFLLAVWRNEPSWKNNAPVTYSPRVLRLYFNQSVQVARQYRPGDPSRDLTRGHLPISTTYSPSYVDLRITDQVTIVQVILSGNDLPPVSRGCSYSGS